MKAAEPYRYEKYSFKVVTPLMALIGAALLANGVYIAGGIVLVLGGLFAFSYQGVIIDPEKHEYMAYDRFLKFNIGGWKKYSTPSYVTIVRINLSSRRSAASPIVVPQDKQGARAFKVNLVVEGNERFIPVCKGSKDKMTAEAIRLGKHLDLRVLDFTTHEKKWIL